MLVSVAEHTHFTTAWRSLSRNSHRLKFASTTPLGVASIHHDPHIKFLLDATLKAARSAAQQGAGSSGAIPEEAAADRAAANVLEQPIADGLTPLAACVSHGLAELQVPAKNGKLSPGQQRVMQAARVLLQAGSSVLAIGEKAVVAPPPSSAAGGGGRKRQGAQLSVSAVQQSPDKTVLELLVEVRDAPSADSSLAAWPSAHELRFSSFSHKTKVLSKPHSVAPLFGPCPLFRVRRSRTVLHCSTWRCFIPSSGRPTATPACCSAFRE